MHVKTLILILISTLAPIERAESATLQYYSTYEYLSASQAHFLGLGVRASFKHITFELSNGLKRAQRSERGANKPSNGTLLGVHIYPFHGPEHANRFVLSAVHLSDLFRGKPFNEVEEPVDHFIGAGYTVRRNDYELDLLVGKESHDCSLDRSCELSTQFKASIRYIF